MLYTTNGGKYWEPLAYDFSSGTRDIHFTGGGTGFVTTGSKTIYKVGQDLGSVEPLPIFERENRRFCEKDNEPIQFTNLSNPAHRFEWWVDGTKQADTYHYSHSVNSPGDHQVTLKTFSESETSSLAKTYYVHPLPTFSKPLSVRTDVFGDSIHTSKTLRFTLSDEYYLHNTFHVELNGDTVAGPVSDIRYITVTTPSTPGNYTYQIIETDQNSCGYSYQSVDTTFRVLNVPFAPQGLSVTRLSKQTVQLNWERPRLRTEGYIVERTTLGSTTFQEVGQASIATSRNGKIAYLDTGLTTSNTYVYRVRAFNQHGLSKPSNTDTVFIRDKVIYVREGADPTNRGTSWQDAIPNLNRAITESVSENEIWVAAGTYYPETISGFRIDDKHAKAIYGGFTGSEGSTAQRNWKVNKTILSGKLILDTIQENTLCEVLFLSNTIADGLTVEKSIDKGITAVENSLVQNCLVQDNHIGIYIISEARIQACIVRNQSTDLPDQISYDWGSGIVVIGKNGLSTTVEIANSLIYNNARSGIYFKENFGVGGARHIYNCTIYANKMSGVKYAAGRPHPGESVNIYNSVFGYREGDGNACVGEGDGINLTHYFNIQHCLTTSYVPTLLRSELGFILNNRVNIDLSFMAGNDEKLGTEDDILHFIDSRTTDQGQVLPLFLERHNTTDKFLYDLHNNPRLVGISVDIGAVEAQDSVATIIPEVTAESLSESEIRLSWDPPASSDFHHLILEKKVDGFFSVIKRIPSSTTEYIDHGLLGNKAYAYRIRLENDTVVSMAGAVAIATTRSYLDSVYVESVSSGLVDIHWQSKHPKIQEFRLARRTSKWRKFVTLDTLPGLATSFLDSTATVGYTYAYQLKTVINDSTYQLDTVFVTPVDQLPQVSDLWLFPNAGDSLAVNEATLDSLYRDGDDNQWTSIKVLSWSSDLRLYYEEQLLQAPYETKKASIKNLTIVVPANTPDTLRITYTLSDGTQYAPSADIWLVVKSKNEEFLVLGQYPIEISQGEAYTISLSNFQTNHQHAAIDSSLIDIQILSAENFTYNGLTVEPDSNLVGNLTVPVTLSYQNKAVSYNLIIQINSSLKANFELVRREIMVGDTLTIVNLTKGGVDEYAWSLAGAERSFSSQEIPQGVVYQQEGRYAITLTVIDNARTSSMTDSITVLPSEDIKEVVTGIADDLEVIKLYPNPVTEKVTIELTSEWVGGHYKIYSVEGKIYKAGSIATLPLRIDVWDYPAGKWSIMLFARHKKALLHFLKGSE